jgi:hypothetical protein
MTKLDLSENKITSNGLYSLIKSIHENSGCKLADLNL